MATVLDHLQSICLRVQVTADSRLLALSFEPGVHMLPSAAAVSSPRPMQEVAQPGDGACVSFGGADVHSPIGGGGGSDDCGSFV